MKKFTILEKNGDIIEIKDGYSWPALFFGWIWGWNKHLGIGHNFLLFLGSYFLAPLTNIYYGFKGNEWVLNRRLSEGYKIIEND